MDSTSSSTGVDREPDIAGPDPATSDAAETAAADPAPIAADRKRRRKSQPAQDAAKQEFGQRRSTNDQSDDTVTAEKAKKERSKSDKEKVKSAARAAESAADSAEAESEESNQVPVGGDGRRFLIFAAIPGWLVSMIVHIVLLFCLALISLPHIAKERENELLLGDAEATEIIEDVPLFEAVDTELSEEMEYNDVTPSEAVEVAPELIADEPDVFAADDMEATAAFTELDPLGIDVAPQSDLLKPLGAFTGIGLEGRGSASRAKLVREGGGTPGSEAAVQMALKWLQQHQNPNGSWSFQHLGAQCPCRDHGLLTEAYNGATAMALLPFLGAGHTHKEGQYQKEVQAALYFLLSRQKPNGAFVEKGGNLYSHGLCAIALSEAFAMTQDQALMRPAQAALDYIAYAQDPVGGGWRYVAQQPGDTSAVGWQLMALKSGRMAYLHVDQSVFIGASKFLDSVQTEGGAAYGYKDPGKKNSTSAIGLLCRMYLGWEQDRPALKRGVLRLSKVGPSNVDMYYNYYATQVMRHYEGEEWTKWNERMREFLIKNQATKGHETGSWHMGKNHSSISGGRLYCTSMATMILEVYYRHLPIYGKQATADDFEL